MGEIQEGVWGEGATAQEVIEMCATALYSALIRE